jgi:Glycosyltransferase family 92
MTIESVTTVKFPETWNIKRTPARPENLRIDYCGGMKFDENFDWDNMWYDCIQLNEQQTILIGPPLYQAKEWMANNAGFADRNGNMLQYQFFDLDRVSYCVVHTKSLDDHIVMLSQSADPVAIEVHNNNGYFNGHKVMVTLQRDNPIEWIEQWMDYHYRNHGIDAFLIYDNGSKEYSINEMDLRLSRPYLKLVIVPWLYPYGPQGSDYAPWDSDYGQYCMLEHAKYRYLSSAELVLNNDIDELIVAKGVNLEKILGQLTAGPHQCLLYQGVWIEPYDLPNRQSAHLKPMSNRKFKDYCCIDANNKRGIGHKWMLVPQANMQYQWLVHRIAGPAGITTDLYYAHHLAMNTNWSWQRDQFNGNIDDLKPEPWLHTAQSKVEV